MKLASLRQHYVSKDGLNWRPKRAFDNEAQIIAFFGESLKYNHFYICSVCSKFHTSKKKGGP